MTAGELLNKLTDIVESVGCFTLVVATETESGVEEITNCKLELSTDGVGQYILLEKNR